MNGAQRNLNENASRHQLISPMACGGTPAPRSHADCVEKIKRNGSPEEKPSGSISARRGSAADWRRRASGFIGAHYARIRRFA